MRELMVKTLNHLQRVREREGGSVISSQEKGRFLRGMSNRETVIGLGLGVAGGAASLLTRNGLPALGAAAIAGSRLLWINRRPIFNRGNFLEDSGRPGEKGEASALKRLPPTVDTKGKSVSQHFRGVDFEWRIEEGFEEE